ncbi:unnamed protein product [Wuchereria bancrofti]|uniref:Uncharacterized protein n=1 Tax=Wuchereria bancrofti TaxID=6293 RepID=A0A3P7EVL2_WUCBA|nr:unnamed protein product [Wuchereria bancrofti]
MPFLFGMERQMSLPGQRINELENVKKQRGRMMSRDRRPAVSISAVEMEDGAPITLSCKLYTRNNVNGAMAVMQVKRALRCVAIRSHIHSL